MSNITFILFAYNEEKRIHFAINNFIDYGEVTVLDGGSTDKTKEITENLGARFIPRPVSKKINVETQEIFDFVKSHVKTEWIYWGYVDNIAPKPLVEKMVEISNQSKIKAIYIPLYTYLWGNTKNYALKSRGRFLFKKEYVDFSDNHIHGFGKFLGAEDEIISLENKEEFALKHFSSYTIHKFILGHLRYAEDEALEKFERGTKFSALKMLAAMVRYIYIYGKYSYKNGILGLLIMLNYAFFRLMAYTKLYELEHGISLDTVEESYSKEKEKILATFK